MIYKEQSERVADAFHEQFVLAEVIFVDVEELAVVDVADQEQSDEECDDHVNACETKDARTDTEHEGDYLPTPEYEIEKLVLVNRGQKMEWGGTFSSLGEYVKAFCSLVFILFNINYNIILII